MKALLRAAMTAALLALLVFVLPVGGAWAHHNECHEPATPATPATPAEPNPGEGPATPAQPATPAEPADGGPCPPDNDNDHDNDPPAQDNSDDDDDVDRDEDDDADADTDTDTDTDDDDDDVRSGNGDSRGSDDDSDDDGVRVAGDAVMPIDFVDDDGDGFDDTTGMTTEQVDAANAEGAFTVAGGPATSMPAAAGPSGAGAIPSRVDAGLGWLDLSARQNPLALLGMAAALTLALAYLMRRSAAEA